MNFKFEGVESGNPTRISPGISEVVIVKIEEGNKKLPGGLHLPDASIEDE